MKEKGGFTLLELIIVVVIIGILGAIALPILITGTERARGAEGINLTSQLREAMVRYYGEHEAYTGDLTDLDLTYQAPKYWTSLGCVEVSGNIVMRRNNVKADLALVGTTLVLTPGGDWTGSSYPYAPTEVAP